MLIRIPVPGAEHVIQFDPDKIDAIETPHEMTDGPGRREFTGRSSLVLHFAAKDDQPVWVPPVSCADSDRELLEQAADALWKCAKSALTVKPSLDQPYPDAPDWTPYTRWVEQPARQAHDLAMVIRKHLKETDGP